MVTGALARSGRRIGLTLTDQGLASVGNFLIAIAVARVSTAAEFGAFTLAYLVYSLGLGALRAGGGDVFMLAVAERNGSTRDAPHLLAFAVSIAATLSALAGMLAVILGGTLRGPLLAMAAVLPIVLLQDSYRYVFFAARRIRAAIAIDALWLGAQLAGFTLIWLALFPQSAAAFLLAWGAAAALSLALGAALSGRLPRFPGLIAWIRRERGRILSLKADFLGLTGARYLAYYLIPLISNLTVLAAVRAAQLVMAPLDVLLTSVRVIVLPALARALHDGAARFRAVMMQLTVGVGCVGIVWGTLAVAIPDALGQELLGDSWAEADPLILAFAIGYVARCLAYPASESVRALDAPRRLLTTRAAAAASSMILLLVGVAVGAAIGGGIGRAAGLWLALAIYAVSLRGGLRARFDGAVSGSRATVPASTVLTRNRPR